MNRQQSKFIAIILFALSSFSCGKNSVETAPAPSSEIDGTWKVACTAAGTTSSSQTSVFSITSYTLTINSFTDAKCATADSIVVFQGTFTIGSEVKIPEGAKKFDSQTSTITYTLKTDDGVKQFNDANVCGGGFVKDTAKKLTSSTCSSTAEFATLFNEVYDIVKKDGKKLFFGQKGAMGTETDSTTVNTRPKELSANPLTKS